MALKLAGEGIGIQEKIEAILYDPGIQDTGDLEAATKTITVTSEASGLVNADYSQALTLPKPDDARLVVKRIAARLQVIRDSGASTNLYCRVYVDVQDAAHRLFDVDAQANPLSTTNLTSGTIFDLLKDGGGHTFYFFFWVNSGNSVISLVQLWEGVGCSGGANQDVLFIDYAGMLSLNNRWQIVGTGDLYAELWPQGVNLVLADTWNKSQWGYVPSIIVNNPRFVVSTTVETDIAYLLRLYLVLRSVQ